MQNEPRSYDRLRDYEIVSRLLLETYRNTGRHVNWVQPRWEYMHYHPLVREVELDSIGVWEESGEIVGVAHPEHSMGTVYLEIGADDADLKEAMLRYSEKNLSTCSRSARQLRVFINDLDHGFQGAVSERGYTKGGGCEPMFHLEIAGGLPPAPLPFGFRLKSLEEDSDSEQSGSHTLARVQPRRRATRGWDREAAVHAIGSQLQEGPECRR